MTYALQNLNLSLCVIGFRSYTGSVQVLRTHYVFLNSVVYYFIWNYILGVYESEKLKENLRHLKEDPKDCVRN